MTDKIEIRMNRGRAIFMASYIVVALLALNFFTFLTTNFSENPWFQFLVVGIDGLMGYNVVKLVIRIVENKPAIVLTRQDITTNYRGVTTVHNWNEITELKIDTTGRYRHILINSPGGGNTKTDITGLEQSPAEIDETITKFKKKFAGRV